MPALAPVSGKNAAMGWLLATSSASNVIGALRPARRHRIYGKMVIRAAQQRRGG
jgi:hypothetical protein